MYTFHYFLEKVCDEIKKIRGDISLVAKCLNVQFKSVILLKLSFSVIVDSDMKCTTLI